MSNPKFTAGLSSPRNFQAWVRQVPVLPSSTSASLPNTDPRLPVLVIGAGPAGLAAMDAFKRANIAFTAVDSNTDVGGLWSASNPNSPAYPSLITNSSKWTTHLQGKGAVPSQLSAHLPREEAEVYLRTFADERQLRPHILFSTTVTALRKEESRGTWLATQRSAGTGESTEVEFRAVVIAVGPQSRSTAKLPADLVAMADSAGIHWSHSADYRGCEAYRGKRVLVVGLGNSGSEVATEVSAVAERCLISVRTTPWIVPLNIIGVPADVVASMSKPLPHRMQMASFTLIQRLYIGHPTSLGFQPPNHRLLDRLPVLDRGLTSALRSKRLIIARNVAAMQEGKVRFEGSEEWVDIDEIVFATGYLRKYPFLPPQYGDLEDPTFRLTLFILHPTEPGLMYMPEMVAPQGVWPLFSQQAKALTSYLLADARRSPRLSTLNALRGSPSPDVRGQIFSAAPDQYYADPPVFTKLMSDFSAWMDAQ